jgi:predicted GTPase
MQLPTPTPTVCVFFNMPQYVKETLKRYLEIKLENWDFQGSIDIYIKEK